MPTEAAPQRGGAAPRRRLQALASHCTASSGGPASLREGGDALDFWIFGHPVTMSPSPPLHEAGFGATGRPHRYTTYDTEDASRVAAMVRGASGGGSVTIPLIRDVPRLAFFGYPRRCIGNYLEALDSMSTDDISSMADCIAQRNDVGFAAALRAFVV